MYTSLTIKSLGKVFCFTLAIVLAPLVLDRLTDFRVADRQGAFKLNFGSVAYAQQNKKQTKKSKKKAKTRTLPGIGPKVMKTLGVVTEFVSPDVEKTPGKKPDFAKALAELKKMEKSCRGKCNKYELSQMYRFYAFAYYSMDNYPKAIRAYENVIAQSPEIPIAVELDALHSLTQLSYAQDKFDDALKYLKKWIALSTVVGADKYFTWSTICYAKGDKACSLRQIEKAIGMIERKGKIAKEQWYGLQLALLLEKESYKRGKRILEKLVRHYPKIRYWAQFANVNGLLNRDNDQLGSLDAIAIQKKLGKRQDIVNLSYLYLGADAPYLAAKNLEAGMKSKKVDRDVKHLKILAGSWRAAREYKKAITALEEAAKAAKIEDAKAARNKNKNKKQKRKYKPEEGNIYAELASLYSDVDNARASIAAGKKAIAAGNLKRPCEVHTNMGISYVDINQYKSAIGAFKKARKYKLCRALVSNWIAYAENEERKRKELSKPI